MRIVFLISVGSIAFGGVRVASADCAAPEVSFSPDRATAGDNVVIAGSFWDNICDDVGESSCFGGDDGFDSHPTQDIEVSLKPVGDDGALFPLREVDANDELDFRLEFTVPSNLDPGRYRVVADGVRSSDVLIVEAAPKK